MPSQIREGIGLGGQLSSWGGAANEGRENEHVGTARENGREW